MKKVTYRRKWFSSRISQIRINFHHSEADQIGEIVIRQTQYNSRYVKYLFGSRIFISRTGGAGS